MIPLPDAMVSQREVEAEKYADENSSKGREDFNRPIRTRAFKAGWDAKASQNDECLRVALEGLKFYGDYMNYSIDYETSQNGFSRRCILYSDIEEINEATGLAGQRAREALTAFREKYKKGDV